MPAIRFPNEKPPILRAVFLAITALNMVIMMQARICTLHGNFRGISFLPDIAGASVPYYQEPLATPLPLRLPIPPLHHDCRSPAFPNSRLVRRPKTESPTYFPHLT